MGKVKIGVIGVGSIAHAHISGYQNCENAELYAFCDVNLERLEEVGKKYGVTRLYTNVDEMLKLEELDAVSVCAMNSEHAPCTIKALNAGKHVICEKPMATTVEDAEEMARIAKEKGLILMIGFVRRFGNDCKVLKDFIDNGYLGDIYYAKATYLRRHGCPGGWFRQKKYSGGGPLIDIGVHVIDLTRYLMGSPKPISVFGATFNKLKDRPNLKTGVASYQAQSGKESGTFDVEDFASAMVRYDNGAVLHVEASFSLNMKKDTESIELFGDKGGAKLEPELELYTDINGRMTNVDLCEPTALSFEGLFDEEVAHFVDCVDQKIPCKSPAEDGVELMRIIDAIYRSAETGHEVIIGS